MAVVLENHIALDEQGNPVVRGTGLKVRLLAQEHLRGDTAERIQKNHDGLTLAQVYAVLSYYYDHRAEMDADMARRDAWVAEMQAAAGEAPLVTRLKAEGRWPHRFTLTDEQLYAEDDAETHGL